MQALLSGHAFGGIGRACLFRWGDIFIVFDVTLQRVRAAVEDQVFGQILFFLWNIGISGDMRGIDNCHVQPSLDAVIQHDRVQNRSCVRRETKRKITYAERSHDAGQVLFDETNPFDGFDRGVGEFFIACGEGKSQRIIDQIFGLESMVVDGDIIDSFCDFEFFLASLRHAAFVDRQHDHRRVVFLGEFENLICFVAT